MSAIRTILHPTDFSALSTRAFQLACDLAKHHGAKLVLLHVLEYPIIIPSGVMMAPPPPGPTEEEKQAKLAELQRLQPVDAAIRVEHKLVVGESAAEIVRAAQEAGCDLIVLGTHGRTGLSRLLLGSVAEQVVRTATCPVVTVKEPAAAAG